MKDLQDIGIGSVVVGAFIGLGCLTHAFPKNQVGRSEGFSSRHGVAHLRDYPEHV